MVSKYMSLCKVLCLTQTTYLKIALDTSGFRIEGGLPQNFEVKNCLILSSLLAHHFPHPH